MKQESKVITDIIICTTKELFVLSALFVHFMCTVFVIRFNSFLSKKSFSPVNISIGKHLDREGESFLFGIL